MNRIQSLNTDRVSKPGYDEFFDELEKSYSNFASYTQGPPVDENASFSSSDQFRMLQLAEKLEKTALDMRTYCRIKWNLQNKEKPRQKKKIPPCVSENIFVITFIWQILCIAILEIVDAICRHFEKKESEYYYAGIIIMVGFQLSNLFLSLAVTVKLTKQYMHQTASMKFLFQSYGATLVLFGGMYTFVAKVMPKSFYGLRGNKSSRTYALDLFSQLLFMSISTGTLCGSSSVTALHIVTELLMSFQMLLSFVYFASILSRAINPTDTKSRASLRNELLNRNENFMYNLQNENEEDTRKRYGTHDTV